MKAIIGKCLMVVAVLLAIGCSRKSETAQLKNEPSQIAMEELKKQLQTGHTVPPEAPFKKRPFEPYIDGRWIGNAISYGCYRKGQAPGQVGPAKAEILEDLNLLSGQWNLIRVYNADDDTERILQVIAENRLPFKMMLGIWLANEEKRPEQKSENIENVLRGIKLANRYPEIVIAVSVGNEAQVFWSWHRMDMEKQLRYVRAVRSNTRVPVTVADDYNFWNKPEAGALAGELDFIVTHIYPLWNGKTLDMAIPWMDSTFKDIQQRYPEHQVVLGETGWATTYNPDKKGPGEQGTLIKGEVSLAAQEQYLREHNQWVKDNQVVTFLFEAFDEPWKGGGESSGPDEVEKHWGVYFENRTPKPSLVNYLKSIR